MPIYKTVHVFNDSIRTTGWTEVWYLTQPSKGLAHIQSQNLANVRLQILSSDIDLTYIRTSANLPSGSSPGSRRARDVLLKPFNQPGGIKGNTGSQLSWVSAQVRFTDVSDEVFAVRMIRGMPGNAYQNDSDKIMKSLIQSWAGPMIAALSAGAFGIYSKKGGPPNTVKQISNIDYERPSHRITGRPLYLYRGRR